MIAGRIAKVGPLLLENFQAQESGGAAKEEKRRKGEKMLSFGELRA